MVTKILAVYSSVLTTVLAAFVLAAPAAARVDRFDEIDVHRINVREPDGTLRMVISNHDRLPGVVVRGKENPRVDRPYAGVLFYNDEGTENGGLVFGGRRGANGDVVDSGVSLSFDRYGANGQFVQLAGVSDSRNHIEGLILSDRNGRKRMVLDVAADGTPHISLFDADGKIVNQIGPAR